MMNELNKQLDLLLYNLLKISKTINSDFSFIIMISLFVFPQVMTRFPLQKTSLISSFLCFSFSFLLPTAVVLSVRQLCAFHDWEELQLANEICRWCHINKLPHSSAAEPFWLWPFVAKAHTLNGTQWLAAELGGITTSSARGVTALVSRTTLTSCWAKGNFLLQDPPFPIE